jgi:uncharacterized phage-associated protein
MFEYDKNAALASVLYIASRLDRADFHRVFKLLYFADKYHLENYGRLIASDRYIAMKEGPVPSATYDIFKALRYNSSTLDAKLVRRFSESLEVYDHFLIRPCAAPDLDDLSDSDIEALNFSISTYGNKTRDELIVLSHDEAWEAATPNYDMTVESIAATLPNRDILLSYLNDPHPG